MHAYNLVGLKSDRTGSLIVGLRPLDYLIDSRIIHARIHSIGLESDFAFCACSTFYSRDFEPELEAPLSVSVFPPKSPNARAPLCICLCIYHVNHTQNVQGCSFILYSYVIFLECRLSLILLGRSAGDYISTSWNGYSATYRMGYDMLLPINWFSHLHV